MFKTKSAVSLILAIVLALGVFSTALGANVPTDIAGTEYEESVEVLNALGIMVGDAESDLFRPEDSIRRSEFAKVAVHLLGLEDVAATSAGKTNFADVESNHWASGYINVASNQKIIIGDPDGNYRPDDNITYAEALTILVRVIGHEPSAKSKGGYPTGYLVVAAENDIIGSTSAPAGEPVKRGVVAELAYNSLTVKLMEQTGFGSDPEYSIVDKTILENKLSIEKGHGQLTANSVSRLTGASSLRDGEVEIASKIYKTGTTNAADLLGYNVEYYAKKETNGTRTLLIARADKEKVSALEIKGDNIHSVNVSGDEKSIDYWVDKENDENTKNAALKNDAIMIYNGKAEPFNAELIKPSSGTIAGKITLVSNNKNDIFDVVIVKSYENMVVEEISTQSNRVIDKYGQPSLILDKNDKTMKFSIVKEGKEIALSDLKEWDVLSIAKSKDGKYLNIIVNVASVTGTVTEIEDNKRIIDGKEYEIAANYTEDIKLEDSGTFYLDIENKIAAVDSTATSSDNYAYLVDMGKSSSLSGALEIKLFTKEGEVKVLNGAEKIKLDTKTGQTAAEVLAALKSGGSVTPQLITYEVNASGEVTAIDTADDKSGEAKLVYGAKEFTKNFVGSDIVYKAASSKLGNIVVDENTIVFDIPSGETDPTEFAIRNKSLFQNESKYDISVFDIGDDLTAKAIIVTNSDGNTNAESSIAVVDKITNIQNSDGISVQKLYALQDGKQVSFITESAGLLVKGNGSKSLEQGDIIQFKTNVKGEIDKITVLFDKANIGTESDTAVTDDLRTVVGKVSRKFAGSMNVTVNNGEPENFNLSDVTVYKYDSTKASNKLTVADASDIQKYDSSSPEYVFIRIYKDQVKEVVILK